MSARAKDQSRAYVRRSTSKQETGIHEQLSWAIAEAKKYGAPLDAAPEDLDHMLAQGLPHYKGLYLDDGVSGSDLNRPAFVAFRQEALANRRISHLFIHISDRFARPEQAVEAMRLEIDLVLAGITLVFSNRVSPPRDRGLHYFDRDILLLHEYTQNGEFLTRLAGRVLQTQARLARQGFRTGGRPPFGFIRVLVDAQSNEVQELPEGTTVRREGCHVILKPHDLVKIHTWLLILHLYGEKHWGLRRIGNHLQELGIPSPDAGRLRRVQGQPVPVSGQWNDRTLARLIDDADIIGLTEYGKRLSGTHRRFGPEGPRTLEAADRGANGEAKAVWTAPEQRVVAPAHHPASADPELFATCQRLRAERGRNRRGIARCPDPARYPLASRVHDLTPGCGAVLYGRKKRARLVYVCSTYMRSGGQQCHHHALDGEAALRFVLSVLRQRVQQCGGREALRTRLLQRATAQPCQPGQPLVDERKLAEQRLAELEAELQTIQRNLALAANETVLAAIQVVFLEKHSEVNRLQQQVERLRAQAATAPVVTPEQEVEAALRLFDEIERLTSDPGARAEIPQLLRKLNVHLWLNFGAARRGTQTVRVVESGILTMGNGPTPGLQAAGQPLPDTGGKGGDTAPVPADNDSMPTVLQDKRRPQSGGFTMGTHGEPGALAPGGRGRPFLRGLMPPAH